MFRQRSSSGDIVEVLKCGDEVDNIAENEAKVMVCSGTSIVSSSEREARLDEVRAPVCFGRASRSLFLCIIGSSNAVRRYAREREEGESQREETEASHCIGINDGCRWGPQTPVSNLVNLVVFRKGENE
jgi:hypothetical protein